MSNPANSSSRKHMELTEIDISRYINTLTTSININIYILTRVKVVPNESFLFWMILTEAGTVTSQCGQ